MRLVRDEARSSRALSARVGTPAALLVAFLLATAGCATASGTGRAATPDASSSASASPAATSPMPSGTFTPAPDGAVNEDTGEVVGEHVVPRWDDRSRAAVVDAATTAMRAFARPDVDDVAWWDDLEPLLSAQAQLDYAYTDPANVPARAVTGDATLVDDTSAYVGRVTVPTDVGAYTVVLSRRDGAAPWLVERITPPDGLG